MSIKRVTQLELENFAIGVQSADEVDTALFTVADVRAREILFRRMLVQANKLTDEEEIPSWADVYQKLLNAGIRPRVAAFIAWATVPAKYRWPKTQEELAVEVLGLTSDRAIANWRKKYPEIDMMITELQAEEMLEFRPGAFHALGTVASDPSYRSSSDRRLFFEMSGDYTPKQVVKTDDGRGAGRKVLDQLKKKTTAELLEMLGEDALELVKDLEEGLDTREEQERATRPADTEAEEKNGE